MTTKQILFTGVCQAELAEAPLRELTENDVLTEMEYTVVSGGTERANLMGLPNTGVKWPKRLGCTRVSDCAVDYYQQVHRPGVKLIGAHNFIRPKQESYPHHWTHQDDCTAILDLIAAGRIQVAPMVSRVVSPENAQEIYAQLCEDPQFPMGTVFDWKGIV